VVFWEGLPEFLISKNFVNSETYLKYFRERIWARKRWLHEQYHRPSIALVESGNILAEEKHDI
jgi:hypothetical protein